jgi:hypothetical protein
MKNCDLLESATLPELAIATIPRELNYKADQVMMSQRLGSPTFKVDLISSGKVVPQMLWPPLPVPVGSPVCIMKPRMLR